MDVPELVIIVIRNFNVRKLLEYKTSQDVSTPTLSRAIYSIALRNDEPLKFLELVVIDIEFS